MKAPDLKSTLVAAAIGAVVAWLLESNITPNTGNPPITAPQAMMYGAVIGIAVQVGVRLTGVS